MARSRQIDLSNPGSRSDFHSDMHCSPIIHLITCCYNEVSQDYLGILGMHSGYIPWFRSGGYFAPKHCEERIRVP